MQQSLNLVKWLISPLPEMINQVCKKYSLENSYDKETSDETFDIFSIVAGLWHKVFFTDFNYHTY